MSYARYRVASHVVVDTLDGYTWWRDKYGKMFDERTAADFARKLNNECKPEYRTYQVFRLVPTSAATGDRAVAAPRTSPESA